MWSIKRSPCLLSVLIIGVMVVIGAGQSLADTYVPVITVPDTIYVVSGQSAKIYYNQLAAQIPAAVGITYSCVADSGEACADGYSFTLHAPTVMALSLVAKDSVGLVLATASTHIRAVPRGFGQDFANGLFVGDSLTEAHPAALDSAYIVTAVRTNFETDGGTQLRLLGTNGQEPSTHEGYSGKCWVNFTSPSTAYFNNPFWDADSGRLDFQKYVVTSGQDEPSHCVAQLGYNGIYALLGAELTPSIMAVWFQRIDTFCNALLSAECGYPDCRIVISLPSSGNISQEAWVDNYGTLDTWEAFERNMATYRQALVGRYDQGAFDPRVSVCASGLFVDRVNGYPINNYLHPKRIAYLQMGGAFYAHLRALLQAENLPTGVMEVGRSRPTLVNYPNPFNPQTTLIFGLPEAGHVKIKIFDVSGRLVRGLVDGQYCLGQHKVIWDGRDHVGRSLASGNYFARLEVGSHRASNRLSIVR